MRLFPGTINTLCPLVLLASLVAGCSEKSKEPAVEPQPPVYTAVTPAELIAGRGGTGGGPNMGAVTVALFDRETEAPVSGATVILRHGAASADEALTAADGIAVFDPVTPGSYSFTAVKQNYVNLTVTDLNCATVALPMERRPVKVEGTVSGVTATVQLVMDFEAKSYDAFENKTSNKYGSVVLLASATLTTWNYEIRLVASASDNLVISEISNFTGKVINRKILPVGPYTSSQVLNTAMPDPAQTGLHLLQINATGVRSGATAVKAWFEDGLDRYESYYSLDSGSGNWGLMLQLPPDKTGAQITVDVYASANPDDGPVESLRFACNTLSADNAVANQVAAAFDMVSVSGDFLNPASNVYLIDSRYNGKSHLSLGVPNQAGPDYFVRVPRNTVVGMRVIGLTNPGSGSLGRMTEHLASSVGPLSGDLDRDVECSATTLLTVTAPIPANMADPSAFSAISGAYSDGKFLGLPFMATGGVGSSDISFEARYQHIPQMTFLMVAQVKDAAAEGSESFWVRGALTDIPTQLGSSINLPLLDVSRILSPVSGFVAPRDSLYLTWQADPDAADGGYTTIRIYDKDSELVWMVVARGTTTQTRLHRLPTILGMDLKLSTDYTATIETARIAGLNFDSFTLDVFPEGAEEMLANPNQLFIAKSRGPTFRVN